MGLLSTFEVLTDKKQGRCWSPTLYRDGTTSHGNVGVEAVSALVFDCDRVPPDPARLEDLYWIAHTTWSHTPEAPRWRLILPLAGPMSAEGWTDVWRRARAVLCPEADPVCKDTSRAYWLPSHPPEGTHETKHKHGRLLAVDELPPLPVPPKEIVPLPQKGSNKSRARAVAYMRTVVANFEATAPGGRNAALNHAAWTLGRLVAVGRVGQNEVEEALYIAAVNNGLVADDGERQCWATIRRGLSVGLEAAP